MAVQLKIPYDTLRDLVRQLPSDERDHLLSELLHDVSKQRPLNKEEKLALLDTMKLSHKVRETPSIRREDWYDDHGR